MKESVYEKFEKELTKYPDNRSLMVISDALLEMCSDDKICELLLDENKTLAGAMEKMKNEAKKQSHNGCACLSFEEGMDIVKKYFGIESINSQTFEQKTHRRKSVFDMI